MSLAKKPRHQSLSAWWRGVGCVMIIALTWGAYLLGGVLLNAYQHWPSAPKRVPDSLGFTIGPVDLPVGIALADPAQHSKPGVVTVGPVALTVGTLNVYISWLQVAMAVVVDVVIYGLFVIVYSRLKPYKLGPTDAPPVHPHKGRPKSSMR
jgi:hypothetical protein